MPVDKEEVMTDRIRKTIIVLCLVALMICVCGFAFTINAYAGTNDNLTLSAEGDKIQSFETAYGEDESFVYTVRARFTNGQAAGIAFGIRDGNAFVLNIDREANKTKLMHFTTSEDGQLSAVVLLEDYYIGNANSTQEELSRVQSRVADKEEFYIKSL